MHLVERMTLTPQRCMVCGMGNVPDGQTKKLGPFIDLELSYNWGDSGYLCIPCGEKVAALTGWITPDEKKDLERTIRKQEKELHEVKADRDTQIRELAAAREDLNRIAQGSKTLKRVRAEAKV